MTTKNCDNCDNCYNCLKDKKTERGLPKTLTTFIVCPVCGNKRCPKATNHHYECTGSNKTGQKGSIYKC